MKDEKIREAISRGQGDVMNHVIEKYSRLLWPIASAVLEHVGSEQDVEECVADAFIYLWQYPEKFDPARGTLKNYLCLVVRSRAIDRYRQIALALGMTVKQVDNSLYRSKRQLRQTLNMA